MAAALAAAAIAGCSAPGTGNPRAVGASEVPLPPGARIAGQARSCDKGVHAFCTIQLVVVGTGYRTSQALKLSEKRRLTRLGWTTTFGPTGKERGSDSPGHELRLTYATAYEDLLALDNSAIQRRPAIARALAATLFDRAPALSIMLQRGSS